MNALDLTKLNRKFDTATDSGLFHTLSDEDRPVFVDNLAAILPHGREILHALLQRSGARRIRSEESYTGRDTG